LELDQSVFDRVAAVIADHFQHRGLITPETTAVQVHGWDSLAHTIVIMKVEDDFSVELPEPVIFSLRNVGDLALAIQGQIDA
jgi:acyl carrier protein